MFGIGRKANRRRGCPNPWAARRDRLALSLDGADAATHDAFRGVLQKRTLCHETDKPAQSGQAIGMLSYTLKIE